MFEMVISLRGICSGLETAKQTLMALSGISNRKSSIADG